MQLILAERSVDLGPILRLMASSGTSALRGDRGDPRHADDRKSYLSMASEVAKTYRTILPDPVANSLAPNAILMAFLAKTIRAQTEPTDVSEVMGEVEKPFDDTIAPRGFEIPQGSEPKTLVNLSAIAFDGNRLPKPRLNAARVPAGWAPS